MTDLYTLSVLYVVGVFIWMLCTSDERKKVELLRLFLLCFYSVIPVKLLYESLAVFTDVPYYFIISLHVIFVVFEVVLFSRNLWHWMFANVLFCFSVYIVSGELSLEWLFFMYSGFTVLSSVLSFVYETVISD